MVTVAALWLPILISAAIVFVVSAMVWMVMPHHKSDFSPVADEDGLMDAVRKSAGKPGLYYFPFADGKDWNTEAYRDRVRSGPVGLLRVRDPGAVLGMTPALVKSFIFFLLVSTLVAYITTGAHDAGAPYMSVFGTAGPAAFLAYGLVGVQESIWFGLPRSVALKHALDGFVYALLTAGVFGWLWPA